ncbi:MAG: hypothetical protein JNK65_06875, partial [Deltaproteobacteria bacterium]|nr:hypothetical protein [Deltaproteobacteria bacterium]
MKPRFQSVMLLSLFISTSVFAQPNKKDSTLNRPSTSSESTTSSNSGSIVVRDQTPEAPAGTPLRAIQDLEKKMDDYQTGDDASAEQKAKNAQIKKEIINGTFDIRELCKLALDKNWGQRSAAEQNQFVSLMTQ